MDREQSQPLTDVENFKLLTQLSICKRLVEVKLSSYKEKPLYISKPN